MKTISSALSNHLDGEVTTLASCWRIVRRDNREFFFTDHDQDIVFEGDTYEAESSYDRTAVANGSDMSVDNMEVAGILDSDKISEEDMRNGLFNRADVYVFIVNWSDPSQGALKVRRGWFGEVTITDTGMFTTEIRGLAQALSHNFIEVYAAECRADFCDSRCKLNIADYEIPTTVSVAFSRDAFVLPVDFVEPSQGLAPGTVRFVDGDNAGRTVEITGYNPTTRTVELFEAVGYEITTGTQIVVAPGCDGSLERCKLYDNVINRRAEDYVPGNDEFMKYPDANQ
jgi:uncharacterized phage protein (TIGR02218 family)